MAKKGEKLQFFCMKCKKKVEAEVLETGKTKRGGTLNRALCPVCNTKMCVMSA